MFGYRNANYVNSFITEVKNNMNVEEKLVISWN